MLPDAGIGIRMRTGRAICVVLIGGPEAPEVLCRRELRLWDPEVPETNQPFHAALELSPSEARRTIERASRAVRRAAERAFAGLRDELRSEGYASRAVGLVRVSDTDPATIRNPHMHAHAAESQLSYQALADAVASGGVRGFTLLESRVLGELASRLARPEVAIRRALAELGRSVGPPWRAEQRAACSAAWLCLAS